MLSMDTVHDRFLESCAGEQHTKREETCLDCHPRTKAATATGYAGVESHASFLVTDFQCWVLLRTAKKQSRARRCVGHETCNVC